jgi:hypothetical protein
VIVLGVHSRRRDRRRGARDRRRRGHAVVGAHGRRVRRWPRGRVHCAGSDPSRGRARRTRRICTARRPPSPRRHMGVARRSRRHGRRGVHAAAASARLRPDSSSGATDRRGRGYARPGDRAPVGPDLVVSIARTTRCERRRLPSSHSSSSCWRGSGCKLRSRWARSLLVLAIDTFGPEAARLPRWVPLRRRRCRCGSARRSSAAAATPPRPRLAHFG